MPTLHQFVPTLEPGATGSHVFEIRRLLRARGWHSELFAYETKSPFESESHDYRDYGSRVPANSDDLLLYHVAIGSVVVDFLLERPERLLLYFHNITPPEYYDSWEPFAAYACTWGRTQVRQLARRATFAMAASAFSQRDLLDAGYVDTAVVPILLDADQFDADVDADTARRLKDRKAEGGDDWLFVGRLSPNKTQEDVIKAFAVYRRVYDPLARLSMPGGVASPRYRDSLRRFAADLGIGDAVDIPGGVAPAVLNAYYRSGDVFVCLSEHEGFGVPVLEAWHHGLPVVAFSSTAIAEIVDEAGVLLTDKSPTTVAAAVHRVLSDRALRQELSRRGRERATQYGLEPARDKFIEVVERVRAVT